MRYSLHENIAGSLPVYIGNNVFIGMGATILMGADIGDNCIIGAGSVVKGTIPPNSVVAGNPARVICKLRSNGMPVPLLRNGYSIFNGTKYR